MRLLIASASLAALIGCGTASTDPRGMALDLARDTITCTVPTDCCAVFDGCKGKALLVSETDRSAVEVLLGEAEQTQCVRCIAPPVQVDCREGRCIAVELVADETAISAPERASQNHCGPVDLPTGWSEKTSSVAVGAGLAPATVVGCSD